MTPHETPGDASIPSSNRKPVDFRGIAPDATLRADGAVAGIPGRPKRRRIRRTDEGDRSDGPDCSDCAGAS
jgi:hypothetical protein